jgi:hypothetical protein
LMKTKPLPAKVGEGFFSLILFEGNRTAVLSLMS